MMKREILFDFVVDKENKTIKEILPCSAAPCVASMDNSKNPGSVVGTSPMENRNATYEFL